MTKLRADAAAAGERAGEWERKGKSAGGDTAQAAKDKVVLHPDHSIVMHRTIVMYQLEAEGEVCRRGDCRCC